MGQRLCFSGGGGGGQLTLDVADVRPLRVELAAGLVSHFLLQPLDLAAQVRDDVGVLGDVVGHVHQVLLHLERREQR